MMPVKIDFASSSLRRTLWHTAQIYWWLAALGLVLCISAVFVIVNEHALQQARQLRQIQLIKAAQASVVAPTSKPIIALAQATAVNAAIWQLNLPWDELQDALEGASAMKVALLTLEPDAKSRMLKITAEAKNSDDMLAYIEQLKQQAIFIDVQLVKHEINELDTNKPLRFQLDVQWLSKALTP